VHNCCSEFKCVQTSVIADINVCSIFKQEVNQMGVVAVDCPHQGRPTLVRTLVDIGTVPHQNYNDVLIAKEASTTHRVCAIIAELRVDHLWVFSQEIGQKAILV
jgi:hypothetical protein